jgi:FkbM family methyltransferase
MGIIDGLRFHHRLFGNRGIALAARARMSGQPMEVTVAMNGVSHPIHLRMRSSDLSLFEEILMDHEYEFVFDHSPSVIVDAGANIGLTSVFFANRFPQARVISIEPEAANYQMLLRNTANYRNIVAVQAALWREDMPLKMHDPGDGDWGFQTRPLDGSHASAPTVPGMTIASLMRRFDIDHIDVLKIDIEGAEKEVFETSGDWIDKVGTVIVELHDRTTQGCSRAAYAALTAFPFEFRKGETVFFERTAHPPLLSSLSPNSDKPARVAMAANVARPRVISVAARSSA